MTSQAPIGLVLAAGAGTRLGRGPKALLPYGGATLVAHVTRELLAGGCASIVVVTGAGAERVAAALAGASAGDIPADAGSIPEPPCRPDTVRCVVNPEWAAGMGSSLRTGLAAIGPDRDVLVTPVDRPGICAAEVQRVIAAHSPGAITAAAHRDRDGLLRRGHPVLFAASWTRAAAAAAHDDVGARELLTAQRDIVRLVDCSDLEDGADLDEPADLIRLADRPGR